MTTLLLLLRDQLVNPERRDVRFWTPNSSRGFSYQSYFYILTSPPPSFTAPKSSIFSLY